MHESLQYLSITLQVLRKYDMFLSNWQFNFCLALKIIILGRQYSVMLYQSHYKIQHGSEVFFFTLSSFNFYRYFIL